MNKQPYPNQAGPKKKKPSMDSDLRNKMEMPKKIGKRNPNAMREKAMIMPKPARRLDTGIMGSTSDQRKKSNMDYVKNVARIAIDPLNVVGALRRAVSPNATKKAQFSPTAKRASSRIADSSRKTKQAQSIAMDKVKSVKSASADSKRKTAQGKTYPPSKKAPSSYALGLTPSQKKKKQGQ